MALHCKNDHGAPNPTLSKAIGIPRGGLKMADALNEYASGNEKDPFLNM